MLCQNVTVSGAYCSAPPTIIPNSMTKSIDPEQYHQATALCTCEKKADGSKYNKCEPTHKPGATNESTSNIIICENKFGCQSPLFPSMLGKRIISSDVYNLKTDLCRCNGGTNYGLDTQSRYCNKFAVMYQRTTDVGYYTPSPRWYNAKDEYDYHAKEIYEEMMKGLQKRKNDTFARLIEFHKKGRNSPNYKALEYEHQYVSQQVSVFAPIVHEFACSLVYPRCARCEDVVEDPELFFNGNQESMSCFDPTTCRALCKKVLALDVSFSIHLKKCLIDGTCTNGTKYNIFPFQLKTEVGKELGLENDTTKICESEVICALRSLPGSRQFDNSLDFRSNEYDFSPFGRCIEYLITFGIMLAATTFLLWVAINYTIDIWKQRREFGASEELRGDGGNRKIITCYMPSSMEEDNAEVGATNGRMKDSEQNYVNSKTNQ